MQETNISLGIGLIWCPAYFNEKISDSNVKKLLQDFGLNKSDLGNIAISYEELCEIHSLAKSLHESVKKL